MLGLVLLRGDEVIALTIEGPPPADALTAKAQNAPVSPNRKCPIHRHIARCPSTSHRRDNCMI